MTSTGLPDGWVVWNDEQQKTILTYRPDIFNSEDFPAACLPTIHVTKGKRGRRPGRDAANPGDPWYVTFYLEPDVTVHSDSYQKRTQAKERATDLARQFAAGEIDYRSTYQVPRPAYFDRLDELTGRENEAEN